MWSPGYLAFLVGGALTALAVGVWLPARLAREHAPMATPLPDVVHAFRPLPRMHYHTPDIILGACFLVSLVLVCLGSPGPQAEERIMGYVGRGCMCLMLRCLTVSVTIVPALVPSMSGALGGHDLMFSGHTICFAAIADCWAATGVVPAPLCVLTKWVLPWTLVLARQHYAADVLVAMGVYHRWAA